MYFCCKLQLQICKLSTHNLLNWLSCTVKDRVGVVGDFPSLYSCSPVTCHWTMSNLHAHPAVTTKAAMLSRHWSAVTVWHLPVTWNAHGKASLVTHPASTAHPHVSVLILLTTATIIIKPPQHWSLWSSIKTQCCDVVFHYVTHPLTKLIFLYSKSTKGIKSGWSHEICQRPV